MSAAVASILHPECSVPQKAYLPRIIPHASHISPSVDCPRIDYRLWSTWDDVRADMADAPTLPFRQSWLAAPEAGFQPASIALAHFENHLIVYAELSSPDIFNPVRAHGENAYDHGDVFEIFLKGEGEDSYFEHHLTPEGYTFQLQFPSDAIHREIGEGKYPDWKKRFAGAVPVPAETLVQPELNLWRILAPIPLREIGRERKQPIPIHWQFSFCRYDYSRDRKSPVLSSTSAYVRPDYHDQSAWGRLTLR